MTLGIAPCHLRLEDVGFIPCAERWTVLLDQINLTDLLDEGVRLGLEGVDEIFRRGI